MATKPNAHPVIDGLHSLAQGLASLCNAPYQMIKNLGNAYGSHIGSSSNEGQRLLDGVISNVMIYDRAISLAEFKYITEDPYQMIQQGTIRTFSTIKPHYHYRRTV